MEEEGDKWEFYNNKQQELYEGAIILEHHPADCWEPPENGSDFAGTVHSNDDERDVYSVFLPTGQCQNESTKVDTGREDGCGGNRGGKCVETIPLGDSSYYRNIDGESKTDYCKRDIDEDFEFGSEVLIDSSLSDESFISMDETLVVDQVDRLKNAPAYTHRTDTHCRQPDTTQENKTSNTGEQFQGGESRKKSLKIESRSIQNDKPGSFLEDSSAILAELTHFWLAMRQSQPQTAKSTLMYSIINAGVMDQPHKTMENEEDFNVINHITSSTKSGPGTLMLCVIACLLLGMHFFQNILRNIQNYLRKPLQNKMYIPSHCRTMSKRLMSFYRQESLASLYESLMSPGPLMLPVCMVVSSGHDTGIRYDNQQRPNIQVIGYVEEVSPSCPPDDTYEANGSDIPSFERESQQTGPQHLETSLSTGNAPDVSDVSSTQEVHGSIHFTGGVIGSEETVYLHRVRKWRKQRLVYGTSRTHISEFLIQRRTTGGVLRSPILHNMSTKEGFQMNRHYEKWKDLAEDECGRIMVCRGLDDHTRVSFLMIERRSDMFRKEELLLHLKYGTTVSIIPELLGVIEEDGYVKMMFHFTPGHDVLKNVIAAGRYMDNVKRLRLFLEQLVRGIAKLHKDGMVLGEISDHMVLLDAELGSSCIQLFPSSVRRIGNSERKVIGDDDLLDGIEKEDDMLNLGRLLQKMLSRLQNPPPLLTGLMLQLLEPDKEKRITASETLKHPLFSKNRCLSIEKEDVLPDQ